MIKKQEQDIKHKRLKQIVDDYNEIQSWLVEHRNRLELLKKDHKLLTREPPYKIHFAVDFHEIYRLVFPLGSKKEINDIKDSNRDDWIHHKVISQTGRICLFYGIETLPVPVLLPPYRDELEDFLFWLKAEYKKAVRQYMVISELKESIKTALREGDIEFNRKDEHFELSDENYVRIIEFIKKYFFQLSVLLMGGYTEEFSILKSLFSDNRIELVSVRWSEYSEFINREIKKVPEAWHGFIREFGKRKPDSDKRENNIERAKLSGKRKPDTDKIERANLRDLLALHLIKALNKKFKTENKKEIVLLVSDTPKFKLILNNTHDDDIKNKSIGGVAKTATGEEIKICRTTDMFHTFLLVKKEREELKYKYNEKYSASPTNKINIVTLVNVEDDLRKIKLIEEFGQDLDNCTNEDICNKTEEVIKKFQEDRKSMESLELAEKFDIYTKIYKHYQKIFEFDKGVEQILNILHDDKKVSEFINQKLENIREQINQGFEKLTENSIIREPVPNVLKIPRGNSFRIRMYDKEVDNIIRNIQKSIRQNKQRSFSRHFSALKKEKKRLDKTKSLKYLSSSLIAAAYEKYDLSLYFIDTGLIFAGVKPLFHIEFKYLEAIVYCNNEKYEKSLTLCKELWKNHQNDCRFPYFFGYIILTGKDDDELEKCSYEEAVEYCKEALAIFKKTGDDDSDLKLYILNNLIYGLAKIGTLETIEEAEQYMRELEGCSNPEIDWGFHIWHTIGYVFFRKAVLLKYKNEDYSEIIFKAIENFETADKKANGEILIIKEDLKKANEMA
ncbi:MAG: tetratricopeptide repeat protein [Candidatus Aminicenantes bacterium]|nr:MAG: tetratricopeptide repeat protein [Candidatus Aminicenantes bacterium]